MPELSKTTNQKYTHEEQVAIYVALQLEGGNSAAASKVLGIPASTISGLKRKWSREGFNDGDIALIEKVTKETVGKSYKIINKALDRLDAIVSESNNIGHLITAIDKLSAHNRLAQGKATIIREERSVDSNAVTNAIMQYIDSTSGATVVRAAEVVDLGEDKIMEHPTPRIPNLKE